MNWFYEMERQFFFSTVAGWEITGDTQKKKVSANEEFCSVRRNNIESHKFYVADGRNPKKKLDSIKWSHTVHIALNCPSLFMRCLDSMLQWTHSHLYRWLYMYIDGKRNENEMKSWSMLTLIPHTGIQWIKNYWYATFFVCLFDVYENEQI